MGKMTSLVKDTAYYGLSNIVGRFLNWALVPLYTAIFPTDEYGVVTYVYSVVAIALVVLNYGLESGLFYFTKPENRARYGVERVYTTALTSLALSGTLFFAGVLLFLRPLTQWMNCGSHTSWVWIMALCTAIDAFSCMPFCYLRFQKRPLRFATIKLINIGLNIGLNLFFLVLCPWIESRHPGSMSWCYNRDYGVGYIFLSNLIASALTLLLLLPELTVGRWQFNAGLWRKMLAYSLPLMLGGLAGIMNQSIDKLLLPALYKASDPMAALGIYGACVKIAVIMLMFNQAFRYAFDPFIFSQDKAKGDDPERINSTAMKYFWIAGLFIFLGVMYFLPVIKYFVNQRYFAGLGVVPIVMAGDLLFGAYYIMFTWFKLNKRTGWNVFFTGLGLVVTVVVNVLLVPRYSYYGSAWAVLACNAAMTAACFIVSRRYSKFRYPLVSMARWTALAAALYVGGYYLIDTGALWVDLPLRALLLAAFGLVFVKAERIDLGAVRARLSRKKK